MKKLVFAGVVLALMTGLAAANTIASSTMYFSGTLTNAGGGVYTGTIDMTAGSYYVAGGPGTVWDAGDNRWETPDGRLAVGGFDVYAKEGGTAYCTCYDPASFTIGSDHNAYTDVGGWGDYWSPNCPDWDKYTLTLSADSWYLQQQSAGIPMGGSMNWTTMLALETDTGAYETGTGTPKYPGDAASHGGGAGAWDMDWSWGSEVVPLELPGFAVTLTNMGGDSYDVTLTPTPEPGTMLLLGTGLVGLMGYIRRRRA